LTLSEPGLYYATWWVATEGAGPGTYVQFELNVATIPGDSPIVTGQLNGSALILVTETTLIQLVNTSGNDVFVANDPPVQANLILIRVGSA
jgi:hypothetical protein